MSQFSSFLFVSPTPSQLSPEARRTFSKDSVEKGTLIRFLSSIEDLIWDQMKEMQEKGTSVEMRNKGHRGNTAGIEESVWSAVDRIFKRYDADGSGAIDTDELSAMIRVRKIFFF